ncbi:nitrate reductase [Shewanella olleyana]|uniref:nitrate reductase n=1 Tax=Shewanella olleyana TaxID=135626 RepID=UPI00200BB0DB|nr:nitrate reductase [Shewanella olleyana]MCL1068207.1 nitrate reductase [Shewanella olleyana]
MSNIQSSCAYCGVGCGVTVSVNLDTKANIKADTQAETKTDTNTNIQIKDVDNALNNKATYKLVGDEAHPANKGLLCAKGERLLESLIQPNTLRYPKLKSGKPVSWDAALTTVAEQFTQTIAEHGPDSVAFYLSGQLLTEDYYVANKLAKGFIGTANVDTNSRLCMSSAVSGHMRAFGEDVVPGCYEDFELADVIVLVGANSAWTHPVLFQRMIKAREQRGTKIVVIDPIKTATSSQADLHLQITPGKDCDLFNGLLQFIAENDASNTDYIQAHTQGFEDLLADLSKGHHQLDIDNLAFTLGLTTSELINFYQLFIGNEKVMTASCQGVNQSVSGTDTTNAMINCHLALGHIGQAGSGFFSLTGQPNAMGGREVGGLATQLACHMGFSEPERQLLADFWHTDNQNSVIAKNKGLTAVELFDAMADGQIKAVWIMGTNPLVSLPNTTKIQQAFDTCPFVVVSDITQDSATAKQADVLLPALGWSEKCGTVTNSERVITRQRGFNPVKGEAKADWWALAEVGKLMGFESAFDFKNSAAVFKEFAQLSKAVKQTFPHIIFDLSGMSELSDLQYDALLPTQWPVSQASQLGQVNKRVFDNGLFSTVSGKAQFIASASTELAVKVVSQHQVKLNSGRSRDQWHTMTRTGHIASLRASIPEPFVAIHPLKIQELALQEGDLVRFDTVNYSIDGSTSADSTCVDASYIDSTCENIAVARVVADDSQAPEVASMSMHWSSQFSTGKGVNQALSSDYDPVSKQPAFKCQTVTINKVNVALQGVIFGEHDPEFKNTCWNVQHTLSKGECFHIGFTDADKGFEFQSTAYSLKWTVNLATKQLIHVQCNISHGQLVSLKLLSDKQVQVGLEAMHLLIGQHVDAKLMQQLHLLIKAGNSPLICACTGVTEAQIQDAMLQKLDDTVFNKLSSEGESRIVAADFEQALAQIQRDLGCGKQCGSCHSEVVHCATNIWQLGIEDTACEMPVIETEAIEAEQKQEATASKQKSTQEEVA